MTSLASVDALLSPHQLVVRGGFSVRPDDGLPKNVQTLLLIGPAEPGFWSHLVSTHEWAAKTPDPVDNWSRRVIGQIACDLGAKALFPFGGPPWHPFYQWALRSGQTWISPVRLLVHAEMGLFASYRGALAIKDKVELAAAPANPCLTCETKPCLTACPSNALTAEGYDLPACHSFLDSINGSDCMTNGCAVRRACPVSQSHARLSEQSAYHMRQFHK